MPQKKQAFVLDFIEKIAKIDLKTSFGESLLKK
jgi:hypothetical protein